MKASELMGEVPALKVLVYGQSGSGKTHWAARSPMPFVILTEMNGLASIMDANDEADVVMVETYAQFHKLLDVIKQGTECEVDSGQHAYRFTWEGEERVCQTIVIDSLTDVQELMATYIIKTRPVKEGRAVMDGDRLTTEVLTKADYGRLYKGTSRVIMDLRSLPVSVVAIAFADMLADDKGSVYRIKPAITGKAGKYLPHWFSVVGYSLKRANGGQTEYGIAWDLPSRWDTKTMPGFPPFVVNDAGTPGKTTLGSLMLATMPVPVCRETDSEDFVREAFEAYDYGYESDGSTQQENGNE